MRVRHDLAISNFMMDPVVHDAINVCLNLGGNVPAANGLAQRALQPLALGLENRPAAAAVLRERGPYPFYSIWKSGYVPPGQYKKTAAKKMTAARKQYMVSMHHLYTVQFA